MKHDLVDSTRERGVGRLILRVASSGAKKFAFRWKAEGKYSFIQIGQYPAMSLSQARDAIKPLQNYLLAGKNPKIEFEKEQAESQQLDIEEAKQGTIEQLFIAYTNKMKSDGKKTYQDVINSLAKEVYPVISKNTRAKDAKVDDFVDILADMIERGAPVQSNRVRSYLHAAFNYGLSQDNDPATKNKSVKFGLTINPISGIPKQTDAEKPGRNYLDLPDIAELICTFRDAKGVGLYTSSILKLCFFTGGQRPHELARIKWDSIDWKESTLEMLIDETKNGKPHLVPLSSLAMDTLRTLKSCSKGSIYVFPQAINRNKHMSFDSITKAVSKFRNQFPKFPKFVPRDIRRSCKTNMLKLGIPKIDLDKLNNHAAQDVSSKHYDMYEYLKEKRKAIKLWDKKLVKKINARNMGIN